ncbi:PRD domain-containing protein [Tessaracoccus oleiagri]|uniref:Transcriptional antiterminator, BglG family n=1 Tax=Tessaracoccus oleiagri TaxID=686624 RepID=A0A1G9HXU7_9ACTN|nr:PRD domain-containing protein [Tessaracoccus oleiagri]SDL17769.1 transcriptional antiterminator, BglG family [Tessaracoccus oleiagri]
MELSGRRIIRVISNNAVLTRDDSNEMVLVGRGIGFGRSDGDVIDESSIQQAYVDIDPERVHVLNWINALGSDSVDVIAQAVEAAADALGGLHPAVYVLLLDHIAFAVQRIGEGETIENPLVPQIKVMYPQEFEAARLAVRHLNAQLGIDLPEAEAGFIALHLNAARSGETVKQPLQRANRLAGLVDEVWRLLGSPGKSAHEDITRDLVALNRRLRAGNIRRNDAGHSIARDLGQDHAIATTILCRLLGADSLPRDMTGEAAFLAVTVHGWRQDISNAADHHRKGNE